MERLVSLSLDSNSCHPRMSVILPVFNAGKYLDAAVESILRQTYIDFELLQLDDGSTDGFRDRLKSFAQRDGRCKIHT